MYLELIKENKFAVAVNRETFDFMAEKVLVNAAKTLETEVEHQEIIRKSYQEKLAKLLGVTYENDVEMVRLSIYLEENAGKEDFCFSHEYNIPRKIFDAYVIVIKNNIDAKEKFKRTTPTSNKRYTVRNTRSS